MATWILRMDEPVAGEGVRLAVKDAIDVAGVPTTVGCAAVADTAGPAEADAECVATARAAGARIVGKTNLHELCFGTSGINQWFGTPVNPSAPDRIPGGSSSGSAVAVAAGEADVAFGTDTGGSIRVPAACCGIAGLKTTFGSVSTAGVWPLAPSLDTVGPLAPDVAGVVAGMRLLVPGFEPADAPATTVGRVRFAGIDAALEAAADSALAVAGFDVVEVDLPWDEDDPSFLTLLVGEAWRADRHLIEVAPDRVGESTRDRLLGGAAITPGALGAALAAQADWRDELGRVFERVQVLALPTLSGMPPLLDAGEGVPLGRLCRPFNLAGTPALSMPIPVAGWPLPGSLQLAGPEGSEELLCTTAAVVEAAVEAGVR